FTYMNNLFNDSIQEKYNLIINRLLNTIKAYEISFNELGVLKYELNIILNHTNNLPYIENF
ncbi:hypothetical protein, partial [Adhaeribacter aquaticus]|uniref:hypothetical protein n=1 Tax=Adhaeribacter aquaticus TaxID=299567 RepID=UPI000478BE8B